MYSPHKKRMKGAFQNCLECVSLEAPKWEHFASCPWSNDKFLFQCPLYSISYSFFPLLLYPILLLSCLFYDLFVCFEIRCHHILFSVCLLSTWLLLNLEMFSVLFGPFVSWSCSVAQNWFWASLSVIHLQGIGWHSYFWEWMRKITDILVLSRNK